MPDAAFAQPEAGDSPGFMLWQVTSTWQRHISTALRPHRLTQVQFVLLASLLWLEHAGEPISQIALARHARLDPMMTSQVLRALAVRGLIARTPHPQDSRAKALTLTTAGRKLARKTVPLVERADADFFAALGAGRADLLRALRSLVG